MAYVSTFNNVFFFLLTAEIVWLAVGALVGYLNRQKSYEERAEVGKMYGILSLGIWAILIVGCGIYSFAAVTTFFVVMVGLAIAYAVITWLTHGRSVKKMIEKKIDTMAQDMVDHAHG